MRLNFGRFLDVGFPGGHKQQEEKRAASVLTSVSQASSRPPAASGQGTVKPRAGFYGEQAARNLHAALCGAGAGAGAGAGSDADIAVVVDVLAGHSNRQRQAIRRHYRTFSDKDLREEVLERLGGHARDVSLLLLQRPAEFAAGQLHGVLQKVVPEPEALIQLLWNQRNEHIREIKETYFKVFGRPVEEVARRELPADLRQLAQALLTDEREQPDPPADVDLVRVREDAQMLVSSGVGLRYSMDEPALLLQLLRTRSYPHLHEMVEQFRALSAQGIEQRVSAEFSGRLKEGLLVLVKMIYDPILFFTEQIYHAINEEEPNDEKLICLIIARSEEDLVDIKDCYLQNYGEKLASDVTEITSGSYRRYLLRLLGHYED